MFTKLQFMCMGSTAPGTGTWPGDRTMTKEPTPALLKQWRGMISQGRHLGKTHSWIQCQFCHGFNDRLDFITSDLAISSVKGDALISLLSFLLCSYHKGQTCLRKPRHELEDHKPEPSVICMCTYKVSWSSKNFQFAENLYWLRWFYYHSHLLASHILPSLM